MKIYVGENHIRHEWTSEVKAKLDTVISVLEPRV